MYKVKRSAIFLFLGACFAAGILSYVIVSRGIGHTVRSTDITETVVIEDVLSESTVPEDRVLADYWEMLLVYNCGYGTDYTDTSDETVYAVTDGEYGTYDEWAAAQAELIANNYGATVLEYRYGS